MRAFSTGLDASAEQIINWFVMPLGLEVTFEEAREHLGLETRASMERSGDCRHHANPAGLVFAGHNVCRQTPTRRQYSSLTTAWYQKTEATFSDCLALVRKHLWNSSFHVKSAQNADFISLSKQEWEHLVFCLSAAA
jgi:hypothetical protein